MENPYIRAAIIIDNILKQGDIRLVDEFEQEFIKLEYEKETTSMIVLGNRDIIRKVFQVVIFVKGKEATLYDVRDCMFNAYGKGRKMVMLMKKQAHILNEKEKAKIDTLLAYFIDEFYKEKSGDYIYAKPTRYLIDKIIDTCENKGYDLTRSDIKEREKTEIIFVTDSSKVDKKEDTCKFNDIEEDYTDEYLDTDIFNEFDLDKDILDELKLEINADIVYNNNLNKNECNQICIDEKEDIDENNDVVYVDKNKIMEIKGRESNINN